MPSIYLIGGPNGAGKTTSALQLLPAFLACNEYVNADAIASGLSHFRPEGVAMLAGRLMLQRLNELSALGSDFAFESTLASRSFAAFLETSRGRGYDIAVIYLWLSTPELAVSRVAQRVRSGGHDIPEATIRRRYEMGRRNFLNLYSPLADQWQIFDNSSALPRKIAERQRNGTLEVYAEETWQRINR